MSYRGSNCNLRSLQASSLLRTSASCRISSRTYSGKNPQNLSIEQLASLTSDALPNETSLDVNHKSVVHIILHQSLHGCIDILNANSLNLTHDVVLGAEIKHILHLLDTPNEAATNLETACS